MARAYCYKRSMDAVFTDVNTCHDPTLNTDTSIKLEPFEPENDAADESFTAESSNEESKSSSNKKNSQQSESTEETNERPPPTETEQPNEPSTVSESDNRPIFDKNATETENSSTNAVKEVIKICNVCSMDITKPQAYAHHARLSVPKEIICETCQYQFLNEEAFERHVTSCTDEYTHLLKCFCLFCPARFLSKRDLKIHLLHTHDDTHNLPEIRTNCNKTARPTDETKKDEQTLRSSDSLIDTSENKAIDLKSTPVTSTRYRNDKELSGRDTPSATSNVPEESSKEDLIFRRWTRSSKSCSSEDSTRKKSKRKRRLTHLPSDTTKQSDPKIFLSSSKNVEDADQIETQTDNGLSQKRSMDNVNGIETSNSSIEAPAKMVIRPKSTPSVSVQQRNDVNDSIPEELTDQSIPPTTSNVSKEPTDLKFGKYTRLRKLYSFPNVSQRDPRSRRSLNGTVPRNVQSLSESTDDINKTKNRTNDDLSEQTSTERQTDVGQMSEDVRKMTSQRVLNALKNSVTERLSLFGRSNGKEFSFLASPSAKKAKLRSPNGLSGKATKPIVQRTFSPVNKNAQDTGIGEEQSVGKLFSPTSIVPLTTTFDASDKAHWSNSKTLKSPLQKEDKCEKRVPKTPTIPNIPISHVSGKLSSNDESSKKLNVSKSPPSKNSNSKNSFTDVSPETPTRTIIRDSLLLDDDEDGPDSPEKETSMDCFTEKDNTERFDNSLDESIKQTICSNRTPVVSSKKQSNATHTSSEKLIDQCSTKVQLKSPKNRATKKLRTSNSTPRKESNIPFNSSPKKVNNRSTSLSQKTDQIITKYYTVLKENAKDTASLEEGTSGESQEINMSKIESSNGLDSSIDETIKDTNKKPVASSRNQNETDNLSFEGEVDRSTSSDRSNVLKSPLSKRVRSVNKIPGKRLNIVKSPVLKKSKNEKRSSTLPEKKTNLGVARYFVRLANDLEGSDNDKELKTERSTEGTLTDNCSDVESSKSFYGFVDEAVNGSDRPLLLSSYAQADSDIGWFNGLYKRSSPSTVSVNSTAIGSTEATETSSVNLNMAKDLLLNKTSDRKIASPDLELEKMKENVTRVETDGLSNEPSEISVDLDRSSTISNDSTEINFPQGKRSRTNSNVPLDESNTSENPPLKKMKTERLSNDSFSECTNEVSNEIIESSGNLASNNLSNFIGDANSESSTKIPFVRIHVDTDMMLQWLEQGQEMVNTPASNDESYNFRSPKVKVSNSAKADKRFRRRSPSLRSRKRKPVLTPRLRWLKTIYDCKECSVRLERCDRSFNRKCSESNVLEFVSTPLETSRVLRGEGNKRKRSDGARKRRRVAKRYTYRSGLKNKKVKKVPVNSLNEEPRQKDSREISSELNGSAADNGNLERDKSVDRISVQKEQRNSELNNGAANNSDLEKSSREKDKGVDQINEEKDSAKETSGIKNIIQNDSVKKDSRRRNSELNNSAANNSYLEKSSREKDKSVGQINEEKDSAKETSGIKNIIQNDSVKKDSRRRNSELNNSAANNSYLEKSSREKDKSVGQINEEKDSAKETSGIKNIIQNDSVKKDSRRRNSELNNSAANNSDLEKSSREKDKSVGQINEEKDSAKETSGIKNIIQNDSVKKDSRRRNSELNNGAANDSNLEKSSSLKDKSVGQINEEKDSAKETSEIKNSLQNGSAEKDSERRNRELNNSAANDSDLEKSSTQKDKIVDRISEGKDSAKENSEMKNSLQNGSAKKDSRRRSTVQKDSERRNRELNNSSANDSDLEKSSRPKDKNVNQMSTEKDGAKEISEIKNSLQNGSARRDSRRRNRELNNSPADNSDLEKSSRQKDKIVDQISEGKDSAKENSEIKNSQQNGSARRDGRRRNPVKKASERRSRGLNNSPADNSDLEKSSRQKDKIADRISEGKDSAKENSEIKNRLQNRSTKRGRPRRNGVLNNSPACNSDLEKISKQRDKNLNQISEPEVHAEDISGLKDRLENGSADEDYGRRNSVAKDSGQKVSMSKSSVNKDNAEENSKEETRKEEQQSKAAEGNPKEDNGQRHHPGDIDKLEETTDQDYECEDMAQKSNEQENSAERETEPMHSSEKKDGRMYALEENSGLLYTLEKIVEKIYTLAKDNKQVRSVEKNNIQSASSDNSLPATLNIPLKCFTELDNSIVASPSTSFNLLTVPPTISTDKRNLHRCYVCSKKFTLKENLREHVNLFHVVYSSSICEARYTLKQNLLAHYMRQHVVPPRRECCVCNEKYKSSALLKKHVISHCVRSIRTKRDTKPIDVEFGCSKALKKRNKCEGCHKRFLLRSCLIEHEKVCRLLAIGAEKKAVKLEETHKRSNLPQSLEKLNPIETNEPVERPETSQVSPSSSLSNQNDDNLTQNVPSNLILKAILTSTGLTYVCDVCGQKFKTPADSYSHQLIFGCPADEVCEICGIALPNDLLRSHVEATHMPLHLYDFVYFCKYCNQGFLKHEDAVSHEKHFHEKSSRSLNRKIDDKIDRVCKVCAVSFDSVDSLLKHNMYFYDGQVCECTLCDITLNGMYRYHGHYKVAHSSLLSERVYAFFCDICDEKFVVSSDLRAHKIHAHGKDLSPSRNESNVHQKLGDSLVLGKAVSMTELHGETKGMYVCTVCSLSFTNEKNFLLHVMEYSADGKFKCYICDRRCRTRNVLSKHYSLTHFDTDTCSIYKCRLCGEVSTTTTSILCHERHFHGKGTEERTNGNVSSPVMRKQPSSRRILDHSAKIAERPCSCLTCDASFPNLMMLRRHLLSFTDIGAYSCAVCQRRFTNLYYLKVHQQRHSEKLLFPHRCPICREGFISYQSVRVHVMHLHPFEFFSAGKTDFRNSANIRSANWTSQSVEPGSSSSTADRREVARNCGTCNVALNDSDATNSPNSNSDKCSACLKIFDELKHQKFATDTETNDLNRSENSTLDQSLSSSFEESLPTKIFSVDGAKNLDNSETSSSVSKRSDETIKVANLLPSNDKNGTEVDDPEKADKVLDFGTSWLPISKEVKRFLKICERRKSEGSEPSYSTAIREYYSDFQKVESESEAKDAALIEEICIGDSKDDEELTILWEKRAATSNDAIEGNSYAQGQPRPSTSIGERNRSDGGALKLKSFANILS